MIIPKESIPEDNLVLITENDLTPTAKGLLLIKDNYPEITDREEIIKLKPRYSHSARINKSKKKELRHLKAVYDNKA
jgi:hypothetical protein